MLDLAINRLLTVDEHPESTVNLTGPPLLLLQLYFGGLRPIIKKSDVGEGLATKTVSDLNLAGMMREVGFEPTNP
jgi:hypothetical protein